MKCMRVAHFNIIDWFGDMTFFICANIPLQKNDYIRLSDSQSPVYWHILTYDLYSISHNSFFFIFCHTKIAFYMLLSSNCRYEKIVFINVHFNDMTLATDGIKTKRKITLDLRNILLQWYWYSNIARKSNGNTMEMKSWLSLTRKKKSLHYHLLCE